MSIAHTWGTSAAERARPFPCDGLVRRADGELFRGLDVDAPPEVVYRWLCQMRAAPYSYDWLDNLGRQSPRSLTPGLDELAPGQRVMALFKLVSFEPGRSLTIRTGRKGKRVFGDCAVSYCALPRGEHTRLLVKLLLRWPPPPIGWLARGLGPWVDLLMMRKQLLTFKELAEADAG